MILICYVLKLCFCVENNHHQFVHWDYTCVAILINNDYKDLQIMSLLLAQFPSHRVHVYKSSCSTYSTYPLTSSCLPTKARKDIKTFSFFSSRWWCRLNFYSHTRKGENPSHHSKFPSPLISIHTTWLTNFFYDTVVHISHFACSFCLFIPLRVCLYANNHKDTHER
jgi:hypothetical protein